MFMYSIDKDIPPPADGRGFQRFPFAKMQPGDSVFIQGAKIDGNECAAAYNVAYRRQKKGVECRFKARTEGDGVRIWRVK